MIINVELSPAQEKAIAWAETDFEFLISSQIIGKANGWVDEIVSAEVERKLAAGEPITGSKEDIVVAANIKTAAERAAEREAEARALSGE